MSRKGLVYVVVVLLGAAWAGGCSEPAPPNICGVVGLTQSCLCAAETLGVQSCQADGSWSTCGCEPSPQGCPGEPVCSGRGTCEVVGGGASCACEAGWVGASCDTPEACAGVECFNGGRCTLSGGQPVCDCPSGTFGVQCSAVCPSKSLSTVACSTVTNPGDWFVASPDTGVIDRCGVLEAWSIDVGSEASFVELLLRSPDTPTRYLPMQDSDDDGVWEVEVLVQGGVDHLYSLRVDGHSGFDTTAPTDPATGLAIRTAAQCGTADGASCQNLFGGTGLKVDCAAGGPGCAGGAVEDYWIGVALEVPKVVNRLRLRSDWWSKRPERWELWLGESANSTPGDGVTLVASGDGEMHPWQCVAGEPCTDPVVPEECCPNGRDQPQVVADGLLISKWDSFPIDDVVGQYFFVRIVSTRSTAALLLTAIELEGHGCLSSGGFRPAAPPCTAGSVGSSAGCPEGQWCSPIGGIVNGGPGCVPIGEAVLGDACPTNGDCQGQPCPDEFYCAAGLTCVGTCMVACGARPGGVGQTNCQEPRPTCEPFVQGEATLPVGRCREATCDDPLGSGGCATTSWCAPGELVGWDDFSEGICLTDGDVPHGEECASRHDCAAGLGCIARQCSQLCDLEVAGPSCPEPDEVCTDVGSGLGACLRPCEFDGAADCSDGQYCRSPALGREVCLVVPSSWPTAAGIPITEPCEGPNTACGPQAVCLEVTANAPICLAICRMEIAPAGVTHPDCPAATPECLVEDGNSIGVCLPVPG